MLVDERQRDSLLRAGREGVEPVRPIRARQPSDEPLDRRERSTAEGEARELRRKACVLDSKDRGGDLLVGAQGDQAAPRARAHPLRGVEGRGTESPDVPGRPMRERGEPAPPRLGIVGQRGDRPGRVGIPRARASAEGRDGALSIGMGQRLEIRGHLGGNLILPSGGRVADDLAAVDSVTRQMRGM